MASAPVWSSDPSSLKVAIAIALHRLKNTQQQASSSAESDAERWKKKAKERKREIRRLREELRLLEDGKASQVVPEIASCRCNFFDGCGSLKSSDNGSGDHWIDDVLRRRFSRLVRWKGRKKSIHDGSVWRRHLAEFDEENEIERLGTSVDFLVELADGISLKGGTNSSFSAIFHQAVDFILSSLKNLLVSQKDIELLEEIVNGIVIRLMGRMSAITEYEEISTDGLDVQLYIQHLMRKLGAIAFVGQHAMLLISQKISAVADSMLFMDPFDYAFPSLHDSIFLMIQLLEFLISDYMRIWTINEDFDLRLFEEWVRSVLQARKGLELLECRNGLYAIYIGRVIGELLKQVGPLASQGKLDPDLMSHLLV